MARLAIVVPCYNEQEVLPDTAGKLKDLMRSLIDEGTVSDDSFIMFIDDGSRDDTWKLISSYASENECI